MFTEKSFQYWLHSDISEHSQNSTEILLVTISQYNSSTQGWGVFWYNIKFRGGINCSPTAWFKCITVNLFPLINNLMWLSGGQCGISELQTLLRGNQWQAEWNNDPHCPTISVEKSSHNLHNFIPGPECNIKSLANHGSKWATFKWTSGPIH